MSSFCGDADASVEPSLLGRSSTTAAEQAWLYKCRILR
jgi:hypothetical protein